MVMWMTEKRYTVIHLGNPVDCVIKDHASNNTIGVFSSMHNPVNEVCDLLNEQEETIKKQNQEILSCHDTLVTIEALCDAVLNYDFKNVTDKIDFCHMLNEMDNKDLMFLKECFEAIKNNDLKQMASLTVECMGDVE